MPRKDNPGPISAQAQQELVSEGLDNFELPKSIVTKIAKSAVPENTKLQKEAILSLVKGSTVFINYLAATAHDVAQSKQHKSISASDVLKALELIELGDLVEPLQAELQAYRDLSKTDKKKSGSAKPGRSSSTTSKTKGKEKAMPSISAPYTSIPLAAAEGESISATPGKMIVADGEDGDVDMEGGGEEEEEADVIDDEEVEGNNAAISDREKGEPET
ncbi:hypothetical protein E1B28_006000 [Marasmius oreades]|uniref:DNA polymerase epsilon subunit D n=1 Tax=Marasmius oreades TaxID=181124 RepID=A0A9P7UVE3_9AGAR|nr:uncharacterized protein E1B28_006000 [Marasmius oreades]KAG7095225.1 hypothetical protein E1B28_006000 [Marasmius oreades]